jgi:antitoxin PrlF
VTHSTLTSKNQTTIPKAVIEALKLQPSDQLVYEIEPDGRVLLSAKTGTFASVAAELSRKPKAKARSTEEMSEAAKAAAVRRFKGAQS